MAKAISYPLSVFVGIDGTMLARVRIPGGDLATSANVASIELTVTNAAGTTTYTASPDPATAIVDLTVNAMWTVDPIGYNFIFVIPGSAWPDAGYYYVLFTFTDTASNTFPLSWQGTAAGTG
jgi:hypothetical protein